MQTLWDSAPVYLRHDELPTIDMQNGGINVIYIYLNYLYTRFLLQRATIKHTNTGHEELFDISRRVLTIVTSMTTQRNSMVDLDIHYSWIVRLLASIFKCMHVLLTECRPSHTAFRAPASSSSNYFISHMLQPPTRSHCPVQRSSEILACLSPCSPGFPARDRETIASAKKRRRSCPGFWTNSWTHSPCRLTWSMMSRRICRAF